MRGARSAEARPVDNSKRLDIAGQNEVQEQRPDSDEDLAKATWTQIEPRKGAPYGSCATSYQGVWSCPQAPEVGPLLKGPLSCQDQPPGPPGRGGEESPLFEGKDRIPRGAQGGPEGAILT